MNKPELIENINVRLDVLYKRKTFFEDYLELMEEYPHMQQGAGKKYARIIEKINFYESILDTFADADDAIATLETIVLESNGQRMGEYKIMSDNTLMHNQAYLDAYGRKVGKGKHNGTIY